MIRMTIKKIIHENFLNIYNTLYIYISMYIEGMKLLFKTSKPILLQLYMDLLETDMGSHMH